MGGLQIGVETALEGQLPRAQGEGEGERLSGAVPLEREPQQLPLSVVQGGAGQEEVPPEQHPGQVPVRPLRLALRPPEDLLHVLLGQLHGIGARQHHAAGGGVRRRAVPYVRIVDVGNGGQEGRACRFRTFHLKAGFPVLPAVGRGILRRGGDGRGNTGAASRLPWGGQPPQPQSQGQSAAGGQSRPLFPGGGERSAPPLCPGLPADGQQFFVQLRRDGLTVKIRFVGFHADAPFCYGI